MVLVKFTRLTLKLIDFEKKEQMKKELQDFTSSFPKIEIKTDY